MRIDYSWAEQDVAHYLHLHLRDQRANHRPRRPQRIDKIGLGRLIERRFIDPADRRFICLSLRANDHKTTFPVHHFPLWGGRIDRLHLLASSEKNP